MSYWIIVSQSNLNFNQGDKKISNYSRYFLKQNKLFVILNILVIQWVFSANKEQGMKGLYI